MKCSDYQELLGLCLQACCVQMFRLKHVRIIKVVLYCKLCGKIFLKGHTMVYGRPKNVKCSLRIKKWKTWMGSQKSLAILLKNAVIANLKTWSCWALYLFSKQLFLYLTYFLALQIIKLRMLRQNKWIGRYLADYVKYTVHLYKKNYCMKK